MDQHFCCYTVPLKVCAKVLRNGWGFEWLCTVWYPGDIDRDSPTRFFSTFEPAWATDQWVTIFSIFVKISPSYSIFRILPGVTYCTESLMTPACVCTPQRTQPDWAWEKGVEMGGVGSTCLSSWNHSETSCPFATCCIYDIVTLWLKYTFLKLLHRPLKRQCHKNYIWINILLKRAAICNLKKF